MLVCSGGVIYDPYKFSGRTCHLELVEHRVVVARGLGLLKQESELLLKRLPADVHTALGKGGVCPLLQADVCLRVERSWGKKKLTNFWPPFNICCPRD